MLVTCSFFIYVSLILSRGPHKYRYTAARHFLHVRHCASPPHRFVVAAPPSPLGFWRLACAWGVGDAVFADVSWLSYVHAAVFTEGLATVWQLRQGATWEEGVGWGGKLDISRLHSVCSFMTSVIPLLSVTCYEKRFITFKSAFDFNGTLKQDFIKWNRKEITSSAVDEVSYNSW